MGSCLCGESRSPRPPRPGSPSGLGVRKRKRKNSRKRLSFSRNNSYDFKKDDYIRKVPGRLFFNGSSEVASLFSQQGKKGTNQDAMIVWENFCSRNDTIFCGVFDGHGPYGHLVAKRVRDSLPQKLNAQWELNLKSEEINLKSRNSSSMTSEDASFISAEDESRVSVLDETDKEPDIFQTLKESFLKAFKVMDRELRVHTGVDCFCSGTTAVTLIKKGKDLVVGNVGDSRAVLGTRDENNTLVAEQLTIDLKPNLPAEAERIKKCRGRVFALQDEPDVCRVWLPDMDSPGLAMARAFGDFCLKDFGLIAVPVLSHRRLTEKDEFVVMATDGIWDVLSNKEVIEIVAGAPSRSTAARALVETAVRAWKFKYPTSKIDDCAVVCLFLDSNKINPLGLTTKEGDDSNGPIAVSRSTVRFNNGDDDDEDVTENDKLDNFSVSAFEGVTRVNTLLNLPRNKPRT